MCEWRNHTPVTVYIPADLSCSGCGRWRRMRIDSCIAPIVQALQTAGIGMRSSCCGHGKVPGEIVLEDGRILRVEGEKQSARVT